MMPCHGIPPIGEATQSWRCTPSRDYTVTNSFYRTQAEAEVALDSDAHPHGTLAGRCPDEAQALTTVEYDGGKREGQLTCFLAGPHAVYGWIPPGAYRYSKLVRSDDDLQAAERNFHSG